MNAGDSIPGIFFSVVVVSRLQQFSGGFKVRLRTFQRNRYALPRLKTLFQRYAFIEFPDFEYFPFHLFLMLNFIHVL